MIHFIVMMIFVHAIIQNWKRRAQRRLPYEVSFVSAIQCQPFILESSFSYWQEANFMLQFKNRSRKAWKYKNISRNLNKTCIRAHYSFQTKHISLSTLRSTLRVHFSVPTFHGEKKVADKHNNFKKNSKIILIVSLESPLQALRDKWASFLIKKSMAQLTRLEEVTLHRDLTEHSTALPPQKTIVF